MNKILLALLFSIIVPALLMAQEKYAVLIVGDDPEPGKDYSDIPGGGGWDGGEGDGYDEFWNDLYLMWETLVHDQGFSDDHVIIFYGPDGPLPGPDGYDWDDKHENYDPYVNYGYQNITDYPGEEYYVDLVFNDLAQQLSEDDFLFVWTFSHGGYESGDGSFLILQEFWDNPENGRLYPEEFADFINAIPNCKKLVLMQQCYGGDFAHEISNNPNPNNTNTVVITATGPLDHPVQYYDYYAFRSDNWPYTNENEEVDNGDRIIHHGEFNYQMLSTFRGVTPDDQTVYYIAYPNDYLSLTGDDDIYIKQNGNLFDWMGLEDRFPSFCEYCTDAAFDGVENTDYIDCKDGYFSIFESALWMDHFKEYDEFGPNHEWGDSPTNYTENLTTIGHATTLKYPTIINNYVANKTDLIDFRGLIAVTANTEIKSEGSSNILNFNGKSKVFLLDNAELTIGAGSMLNITDDSEIYNELPSGTGRLIVDGELVVQNGAVFKPLTDIELGSDALLKLNEDGSLVINEGVQIIVKSGGTLYIQSNSNLDISGNGRIIVESGGYICIEPDVDINLADVNSIIELQECVVIGVNPVLNITSTDCLTPDVVSIIGNGNIIYDNFVEYTYTDNEIIYSSQPWDNQDIYFQENLTITSGVIQTVNNSTLNFNNNKTINISNGGILILENTTITGVCAEAWDGILNINDGGKLILSNGSLIKMGGNGIIDIYDQDGTLQFEDGANILLNDENTKIEVKGKIQIEDNATFTFTGAGYIYYNVPVAENEPSIIAGTNSKVRLIGEDPDDIYLEIAPECRLMPEETLTEFRLSKGTVIMNDGSVLDLACPYRFFNTIFNNEGGGIIRVDGTPYSTITSCTFNGVPIFGDLSIGGNALKILSNTSFNNCTPLGIEAIGGGVDLNSVYFDNCNIALYSHGASLPSRISGCNISEGMYGIQYYNSNAGMTVYKTDIENTLNHGIVAGESQITLKCSNVSNSNNTGIYIDHGSLDMSNDLTGGFNKVSNILLDNVDIDNLDINNGYNDLSTNIQGGTIISGTVVIDPPPPPDNIYHITMNRNQWYEGSSNTPEEDDYSLDWKIIMDDIEISGACIIDDISPQSADCPTTPIPPAPDGNLLLVCSTCSNIITPDFPDVSYNEAVRTAISKMELEDSTQNDLDAVNLFHQILMEPIDSSSYEVLWLSNYALRKMNIALSNAFSTGRITVEENFPALHQSTQQMIDVYDRLTAPLTETNYLTRFYIDIGKAQVFRLAGRHELALAQLNSITPENCYLGDDELRLLNTLKSLANAEHLVLTEQIPKEKFDSLYKSEIPSPVLPTYIDPDANLNENVDIGDHVSIGAGTTIQQGVTIADNVTIGNNVTIQRGVTIGEGTVIEDNTLIQKDVFIGSNNIIGQDVVIKKECILGDNVKIEDGVSLDMVNNIGDYVVINENTQAKKEFKVSEGSYIGQDVKIDKEVSIGNNAIIRNSAEIKKSVKVGDRSVIGENTRINKQARIGSNAIIEEGITIGNNAIICDSLTAEGNIPNNGSIGSCLVPSEPSAPGQVDYNCLFAKAYAKNNVNFFNGFITENRDTSIKSFCTNREIIFKPEHLSTEYIWDFGDCSTSTEEEPVHIYEKPGIYVITLTQNIHCGEVTKIGAVTVYPAPTPGYISNPLGVCEASNTIIFDKLNTPADMTLPSCFSQQDGCDTWASRDSTLFRIKYTWNFGDISIPDFEEVFTFKEITETLDSNITATYNEAGTYIVTLTAELQVKSPRTNQWTDTKCISEYSDTVTTKEALNADFELISGFCANSTSVFLNKTIDGIEPVSYQWDFGNGDTSTEKDPQTVYDTEGLYDVTLIVTDGIGCIDTTVIPITIMPGPELNLSGNDLLCYGDGSGTAEVTATGGTEPYSYLWSNGENTKDISNLYAGTYMVTVTDQEGCASTGEITINEPEEISLSISSTYETCCGMSDGTATISVTGGTPGFLYVWSDPLLQKTPTAHFLAPGDYTVSVIDNNACKETADITVITDPALFNYDGDYVISLNTTWTNNYSIDGYVEVESGVTLTIQGVIIEFCANSGVKLQKDARLIIDNSTITGLDACNNMWGSIAAGPGQARIEIINGSVIENAVAGIDYNGASSPPLTYSGINADNSTFRNNQTAVNITNQKYIPGSPPVNNNFTNCLFEINNSLLSKISHPVKFINMEYADAVFIDNNNIFRNTNTVQSIPPELRPWAITSINSSMLIVDDNEFHNVFRALGSLNGTFIISNCDIYECGTGVAGFTLTGRSTITANIFNKTKRGIRLKGTNNTVAISNNNFVNIPSAVDYDSYGMFMENSGSFLIWKNDLNGYSSTSGTNYTYGIVVEGSDRNGGVIFRNNTSGTDYGIQAQGYNPALSIRCNNIAYSGLPHDQTGLAVLKISGQSNRLMDQGIGCSHNGDPAGNEWVYDCTYDGTKEIDIKVQDDIRFRYYSYNSNEDGLLYTIPDCSTDDPPYYWRTTYMTPNICTTLDKTGKSCQSYIPGLDDKGKSDNEYISSLEALKAEYEAGIDSLEGGKDADPEDLLAFYLANIQIIENEMVNHYLEYEEKENAKQVLIGSNALACKKQLVEIYLSENDLSGAREILDTIDQAGEEEQYFCTLMYLLADLSESGRTIFELNSEEEQMIRSIAETNTITAGKAEAILEMVFSEDHEHPIIKFDDGKSGSFIIDSYDDTDNYNYDKGELKIYPNPTPGNFTMVLKGFNITGSYSFEVINMAGGRIFKTKDVTTTVVMIDISDQPKGTYFVIVYIGDEKYTGKIVYQ